MPFVNLFRRASTYILGGNHSDDDSPGSKSRSKSASNSRYYDEDSNEVLYCKNNICVHPPASMRYETDVLHHPGYLTITSKTFVDQYNSAKRPTLMLTWIPNASLSKSEDVKALKRVTDKVSPKKQIIKDEEEVIVEDMRCTNPFLTHVYTNNNVGSRNGTAGICGESNSASSPEDYSSCSGLSVKEEENGFLNVNVQIAKPDIEISERSEFGNGLDADPDVYALATAAAAADFVRSESATSNESACCGGDTQAQPQRPPKYNWLGATPELLAQQHNLAFPFDQSSTSSPVSISSRKASSGSRSRLQTPHRCRRFSVDLSQMRSLRLFFSDSDCTCGQVVVASRESQYKILHFHHGGLDHLAQVLHQWHALLHNIKYAKGCEDNLPFRHFMVCRPEVSEVELHPEEGQVPKLTRAMFRNLFNDAGQLEDDLSLRKSVFFAGMERSLRKEVWPFLLHCYPYQSSYEERLQIAELRRQEYDEITRRRNELPAHRLSDFRRQIQSVVDKDVVRTDRGNPYFAGEDNTNLDVMRNILLNYAVYNPTLGYTQGMSDLLAPVLCELDDEVAAFWCFVGLMQRATFVATPTDRDMDRCLRYLRELIHLMLPSFHKHLEKHLAQEDLESSTNTTADGTSMSATISSIEEHQLLFCHRWILLCFKREFPEAIALRMWEACWANFLTDYFHLFLCLAIISVYAEDVILQDLKADEMLLHFSSLAMYMDGAVIGRKARGLLHQFRQLREIPCTLAGLCTRCGPGIWDSAHSPRVYCAGDKHLNGGGTGNEACCPLSNGVGFNCNS